MFLVRSNTPLLPNEMMEPAAWNVNSSGFSNVETRSLMEFQGNQTTIKNKRKTSEEEEIL